MKLLLDTHVFIWLDTAPERLSPTALTACQDPENSLLLSVASAWEMEIKQRIGKLRLDVPFESMVQGQQNINQLQLLSIELQHVLAIRELPPHHSDPFDRLLLAQARFEGAFSAGYRTWTALTVCRPRGTSLVTSRRVFLF